MLKSIKTLLFSLIALGAFSATSQATFNVFVGSTGGPAFASYNQNYGAPGTYSDLINLTGGAPFSPGLTMSYSITNSPSSGQFTLNNLSFIYLGNPTPISLQVALTENTVNFLGNGTPLTGFASFTANGNTSSIFGNTTTFTPGTGANSLNFPSQNFSGVPTLYNMNTSFVSGGSVGTVQSVFNITITPNSNVSFSAGGGFGSIGVADATLVPAPPAVFLGLLAIPTLAGIRRRFAKSN